MSKILVLKSILLCLAIQACTAQAPDDPIHLNQIGFYPDAPKVAVMTTQGETTNLVQV